MTYRNQWSRLTYLTLSHLHWSGRTQALYSCCHHLNRCVAWRPTWSMIAGTQNEIGRQSTWSEISQLTNAQCNEVHSFHVSTFVAAQIGVDHLQHGKCSKSTSSLWHAWPHLVLIPTSSLRSCTQCYYLAFRSIHGLLIISQVQSC